jgi:hypothetical protein
MTCDTGIIFSIKECIMKYTRKKKNGKVVTYTYESLDISDRRGAAAFLLKLSKVPGFTAKYIALKDLQHKGDEGRKNLEFIVPFDEARILDMSSDMAFDRMYLAGRLNPEDEDGGKIPDGNSKSRALNNAKIGIGINLLNYEVDISIPIDYENIIDEVVKYLVSK